MKISPKHFRQKDDYSCTSCVLKYALYKTKGVLISSVKANKLTKCKPDGTTFKRLKRIFEKLGFETRRILLTERKILHYLKQGHMIVIDDLVTWDNEPHATLIMEYKNKKLYVFDSSSMIGMRKRSIKNTIKTASEAFAIKLKVC